MTRKDYEYLLIESHVDQISIIVNVFLKKHNYKYSYLEDDMYSLGNEVLVKSARKYDHKIGKVKFKTYFYNNFTYRLKNLIQKEEKYKKKFVNVDDFEKIYNQLDLEEGISLDVGILDMISDKLTEEEMSIVNQNLTGSLTNKEMANELGMKYGTFKGVRRRLKDKIKQLVIDAELFNIKEGNICLK